MEALREKKIIQPIINKATEKREKDRNNDLSEKRLCSRLFQKVLTHTCEVTFSTLQTPPK